jgi:hypothetical protein
MTPYMQERPQEVDTAPSRSHARACQCIARLHISVRHLDQMSVESLVIAVLLSGNHPGQLSPIYQRGA